MGLTSLPTPEGYGWTSLARRNLEAVLPEVTKASQELLKCGCNCVPGNASVKMLGYLALLFATAVGHVTRKLPITQNHCDD
jgi:hypothetical protein